jgi:hypothetical protein
MAKAPIFNAASIPLNQKPSGNFPQLGGALLSWFQPMQFSVVTKTNGIDLLVTETMSVVEFLGVWQPFSAQMLELIPEGQRDWKWFTCHAQPGLALSPDDVVTYVGMQYRVMQKLDYTLNAYIEYHLVQDYEGSGPKVGG